MHFVIMGCGRVGSTLAHILEAQGHTVAVIDSERVGLPPAAAPASRGRRVTGIGFDRDTLREAGIEEAQAFAAVSSGDNSNIIAARVARETFGVENVVARIYDPRPRRGLPAAGHPHRRDRALDGRPDAAPAAARTAPSREWRDPSGDGPAGRGRTSTRPGSASGSAGSRRTSGARVAFLTRLGEGLLPGARHRPAGRRPGARDACATTTRTRVEAALPHRPARSH